jgi:hypothetical protein
MDGPQRAQLELYRPEIRTVTVTRYVTPLREGGSLPAIVEGDDLGTYVLKFRGAGQGPKVLIAELLAGEIGRALDLPVPELVFAELDRALGAAEPDPEIQDLIKASAGLNLALDYLPGSFAFDPCVGPLPAPELASSIVWFDAYITNVDRTPRNTNLLIWHRGLWLIDNGASLYFHFGGPDYAARAGNRFPEIRKHVLLPYASDLREVDPILTARLTPEVIGAIVKLIPDSWVDDPAFPNTPAHRAAYADYLLQRLEQPHAFVEEAIDARSQVL